MTRALVEIVTNYWRHYRGLNSESLVVTPIMCDTSDFDIEAILGQRHEKIFRAIYYASRTLNEA